MSFFDDASLVMIPSGYKDQKVYSVKPLDGTGDLTFTRSNDTASRVNSSGLIEKVRTNVLLYSQDFSNAAWGTSFAALTGGQSGYDGTNNAWKLQASGSTSCYISQGNFSLLRAHSIYAKAGTYDQVSIIVGGYGQGVQFDLTNGTIVTNSNSSIYSPTITSVGSGWYKISLGIQSSAPTYGFLIAPQVLNGGGIVDGEYIYIQNAQTEYNDIATDYIATTSAAVSVGPVANLPRLDYSGGATCPSLLLEPQRTNLVTFSESFDNAAWNKSNITVTANAAISPDGYTNADLLNFTSVSNYIDQSGTIVSGTTYTVSCYVKSAVSSNQSFRIYANANKSSSVLTATQDWQRFTYTFTADSTAMSAGLNSLSLIQIYAYGFQLEEGAYATSYIPTLSAAVTRGEDICYKTGIGSLLSASEYTLYWEGTHIPTSQYNSFMTTYNNANQNLSARFYRNNTNNEVRAAIFNTAVGLNIDMGSGVTALYIKCALRVKAGAYAFYVNGSLVNSTTNALAPASTFDTVNLQYFNNTQSFDQKTAQVLFFKTGLTNAQLAELTTL